MLIFLLYALPLVILLKVLGFFQIDNFRGWGLYFVLIIKLALAFLLFHFPYESMRDSQIYLHDSRVLSNVLFDAPKDFFTLFFDLSPSENLDLKYLLDTNYWSHETTGLLSEKRNVIRVNAWFQILGFQQPYIVFFWNAVIGLLGLKLMYQAIRKYTSDQNNLLFLSLFLLPSTLLWTSNIMKESYMLLGLGLFLYGLLYVEKRKKQIYLAAAGLLIMLLFKQYVAIGFLVGLVVYLLLQINPFKLKFSVLVLFFSLSAVVVYFTLPKFTEQISKKQFDFIRLAKGGVVLYDKGDFYKIDLDQTNRLHLFTGKDKNNYAKITQAINATRENHGQQVEPVLLKPSDKHWYVFVNNQESGSRIDLTPINNESKQLLKNIPEALINVGFRPFPNDPPKSLFKWYFILENLFLWSLFIAALFRLKNRQNTHFVALLLISSLVIALFIGWTTPVIGALVRYKLPVVVSLIAVSWLLLFPQTNIISKEKQ